MEESGEKVEGKVKVTGLPSALLLPARDYEFNVYDTYKLIIPKNGKYHDLAPEIFDENSGEFHLFKDGVLHVPAITRVLLACNKYPDLKSNQALAILSIQELENTVAVFVSLVEFIVPGGNNNE